MNSNLTEMAIELLYIEQCFRNRFSLIYTPNLNEYDFYTFEQMWGNTSGGFQGIGGCAITTQRTYVFIPKDSIDNNTCFVFFGGNFAYQVQKSKEFLRDVKNENIAGVRDYKNKYKTTLPVVN